MKTKTPVSTKKQNVTLKDLTTSKDPKGGFLPLDPQAPAQGKIMKKPRLKQLASVL